MCSVCIKFVILLDVLTIPLKFMINYITYTDNNRVACEICKEDIGFLSGEDGDAVTLTNCRYGMLEHVMTLPDCVRGIPETFTVNRFIDIEDNAAFPSPNISLMNVSDTNLTLNDGEFQENIEVIDLTKSTPRRSTIDETIETVVCAYKTIGRSARAKLEFVDLGIKPLEDIKNMFNNADYFDLAVPLPNEKMPIFKY